MGSMGESSSNNLLKWSEAQTPSSLNRRYGMHGGCSWQDRQQGLHCTAGAHARCTGMIEAGICVCSSCKSVVM